MLKELNEPINILMVYALKNTARRASGPLVNVINLKKKNEFKLTYECGVGGVVIHLRVRL